MRRFICIVAAGAVLFSTGGVANAGTRVDPIDRARLDRAMDAFDAAGMPSVIAQVRDGDAVWAGARGDRELDGDAKARPGNHVRVASLTKSMVATVALQLSDEGSLDLDAPVTDALPGLLPYDEPITARQLLNHSSGIGDYVNDIYPSLAEGSAADVRDNRRETFTPAEIVALATDEPLAFPPGEGYEYSNTNYFVLGLLIEAVGGESLHRQLRQRVFDAVGMDHTYLPRRAPVPARPFTHPYLATGEAEEPLLDTADLSPTQLWAAWGVISTPGDVNAFYRAMSDGTLLSAEQLAQARQPNPASKYGYGLGLERFAVPGDCAPIPGGAAFGHTGGGLGHTTWSFHSPNGERQASVTIAYDPQLAPLDEMGAAMLAFIAAGLCDDAPATGGDTGRAASGFL